MLYGAFSGYNGSRGRLFKLTAASALDATYDFGWDTTPSVFGAASD